MSEEQRELISHDLALLYLEFNSSALESGDKWALLEEYKSAHDDFLTMLENQQK